MKRRQRDQLLTQCRILWEEFDPIGLSSSTGDVTGEYEGFLSHSVELVAASADRHKLSRYVQNCVYINIGLSRSSQLDGEIDKFVFKLREISDD